MNIINISEKIEDIIVKNGLGDLSSSLKDEYAITKSRKLQETLTRMEDEGRTLKVGIVGRVKAGKSSLLNALIFDGKEILPKAATPMTAALTILEYGDKTQAKVEFFTEDDIRDIHQEYKKYIEQLDNLKQVKYEELAKIKLKKLKELSQEQKEEIRKKATDRATKEMRQNDKLFSSYDQYTKIKKSGVNLSEIQDDNIITATSTIELNEKLLEFVGANGKYMPFTKSATLKLKHETLKDIQIIDTPGVNDPVTSREDRTKELLKDCDVVLVISPAGQFLSTEDIDLMDRITSKEGIKEIYLVASQSDSQLFGSEKEKANGIFGNVLKAIEDSLTEHQNSVLIAQKQKHPEIGNTFDKLIKNRVILSSGISYSMMKNFESHGSWDETTQKVWENLNLHYKDFFSDTETSLSNLNKLANISQIQNIISEVKIKKDEILQQRKNEFIAAKQKTILDYKEALENDINNSITRIQNSDIDEIRQQKDSMEAIKNKASFAVDEEYVEYIEDLEMDFSEILNDKFNSFFRESQQDIASSEGSKTETEEVSDSSWYNPFSYGRTKLEYDTYTIIKAGYVRNSLEELTYTIETTIDRDSKKYIRNWKRNLTKKIVSVLRSEAGDDNLDAILIKKVVRGIINSVKEPEINYTSDFPDSLKKSGTLKRYDAENFINDANNYISEFKNRARKDIKSYINILIQTLKKQTISKDIFQKYAKDIEKLEKELLNKEQSITNYNNILIELQAVTNA
jgi:predicted GTPase